MEVKSYEVIMKDWETREDNKLRDTIDVKVIDLEHIKETADEIEKLDHVYAAKYGEGMVEQLVDIFDIIKKASYIAVIALIVSIITQKKLKREKIKQATIEQFNIIQNQVLDNLATISDKNNAKTIVEELELIKENQECKKAYDDYRVLIARLEHFAVGVNEGVYDSNIVDKLSGVHLIYLLPKIQPIIDKTNENAKSGEYYYGNFVQLVNRLQNEHPNI